MAPVVCHYTFRNVIKLFEFEFKPIHDFSSDSGLWPYPEIGVGQ